MIFLILIFVIHYIADFILQTEWMALNKSLSFSPLLAHVAVYTSALFMAAVLAVPFEEAFLWAIINGLAHFCVDYFTSRLMRWAREQQKNRLFFQIYGIDQTLHYICLFLTLELIL